MVLEVSEAVADAVDLLDEKFASDNSASTASMAVFTILNADEAKTGVAGAPPGTVAMAAMAGTTLKNVNRRPNLVVVGTSIVGVAMAAAMSWWLWDVVVEPSDFVPRALTTRHSLE
jgi:hypothetical protein